MLIQTQLTPALELLQLTEAAVGVKCSLCNVHTEPLSNCPSLLRREVVVTRAGMPSGGE